MKNYKNIMVAGLIVLLTMACNLFKADSFSSPTKTFKTFHEAVKRDDVQTMKKSFSKADLEALEKVAKAQNKSSDDLMKQSFKEDTPKEGEFELRNEKITGDDTATLEVKHPQRTAWRTLYFVKEDGAWKFSNGNRLN